MIALITLIIIIWIIPMTATSSTPLNRLQVGTTATIQSIDGDSKLSRKLLGLGLRVGSQVDIVQHRNRGVVVANAGNRVALGQSIAEKLLVITIAQASPISN